MDLLIGRKFMGVFIQTRKIDNKIGIFHGILFSFFRFQVSHLKFQFRIDVKKTKTISLGNRSIKENHNKMDLSILLCN